MKKIMLTTVRTLLAIAAIIVFAFLGMHAYNWQAWCPNNDLGFCLIVCMYLLAAMGIGWGFYGISPIFWEAVFAIFCAKLTDDDGHIDYARRKIRYLRKRWAW